MKCNYDFGFNESDLIKNNKLAPNLVPYLTEALSISNMVDDTMSSDKWQMSLTNGVCSDLILNTVSYGNFNSDITYWNYTFCDISCSGWNFRKHSLVICTQVLNYHKVCLFYSLTDIRPIYWYTHFWLRHISIFWSIPGIYIYQFQTTTSLFYVCQSFNWIGYHKVLNFDQIEFTGNSIISVIHFELFRWLCVLNIGIL